MRTETYEMTAGHKYHVYCALGGSVYKCKDAVAATASVTPLESYAAETEYSLGIGDANNTYGGFTWTPGEAATPADFVDALNYLDNWGTGPQQPMETPLVHAALDEDTGKVVLTLVDENWIGTDGNALKVTAFDDNLPISDEVPVSFSGGADYSRTLVGVMDRDEKVSCQAAAPWTRLEVEVPDAGWVQFQDASVEMETRTVPTVPGLYYQVYAEDETHVFYRNTPLLEFLYFGGVGVLLAPGTEVVIQTTPGTEVNMFACAPTDIASVYRPTYPRIDSFNPF